MRQLQFNHIGWKPLLVKQRARHAAESVSGLLLAAVPKSPQGGINRIVRHGPIARPQRRKKVSPSPGQRFEFSENCERLVREGHNVRLAHFHSSGWYPPFGTRNIELRPFGCP
jgi:hypothetical protein